MNLFNMPCDNLPAIQRFHYELCKILQPNYMNPITTYNHLLRPERHFNCALVPNGSLLSSNNRRTKIMQKLINDNINKDEDANDDFDERALNMIDKKHNDVFFKYSVSNKDCTNSTELVSSVHRGGVYEAASLRINQQRIVKTFLNLYFDHKFAESDEKLAKFNYVSTP